MLFWVIKFLISAIIGFAIAKLMSGPKEGIPGKWPPLKFIVGQYTIWLHHWFCLGMLIIVMIFMGVNNPWIYGVLFGAIIQGLMYKDFYYIFFKTKNYPYKKI